MRVRSIVVCTTLIYGQVSDSEDSDTEDAGSRRHVDRRNPLKGLPYKICIDDSIEVFPLSGHSKAITALEVTSDMAGGPTIAITASIDKLVKCWDMDTGKVTQVCSVIIHGLQELLNCYSRFGATIRLLLHWQWCGQGRYLRLAPSTASSRYVYFVQIHEI